jgi:hypothetical protein
MFNIQQSVPVADSRLLNANDFDLCDESKTKYKLISLYWFNLQRGK